MATLSVKRSIEPSSHLSQCPIRTIDVVDVAMSRKIAFVTFSRLDQVIIVVWGKILCCYHSNETFLIEFSHSAKSCLEFLWIFLWNFESNVKRFNEAFWFTLLLYLQLERKEGTYSHTKYRRRSRYMKLTRRGKMPVGLKMIHEIWDMVFNTRSDTEKTVENTTCRQAVLTKFEGFDILMKQIFLY